MARDYSYSSYGGYIGRVILLVAGLLMLAFLVWAVIQLADSDSDSELADGEPRGTSSSQTEGESEDSESNGEASQQGEADIFVNDTDTDAESESGSSETAAGNSEDDTEAVVSAGDSDELPATGAESVILPALTLGAMTFVFVNKRASKENL